MSLNRRPLWKLHAVLWRVTLWNILIIILSYYCNSILYHFFTRVVRRRLLVSVIDHYKIFCNAIPHAAYYCNMSSGVGITIICRIIRLIDRVIYYYVVRYWILYIFLHRLSQILNCNHVYIITHTSGSVNQFRSTNVKIFSRPILLCSYRVIVFYYFLWHSACVLARAYFKTTLDIMLIHFIYNDINILYDTKRTPVAQE